MPFKIPQDCDQKLAWEICLGKGPPTTRQGWWGSMRCQVKAFFTFSWKLKAKDISKILDDSSKREVAVKTMIANPRWLQKDLSLLRTFYEKLGSKGEDEKLKGLIAESRIVDYIVCKRLGEQCGGLEEQFRAAARRGDVELLRLLLAINPDLDINCGYFTALIYAAENGHAECVDLLMEKGADIMCPMTDWSRVGTTARMYAAQNGHVAIKEKLKKHEELHYAAFSGDITSVRDLLQSEGISINTTTNQGFTALIWAAYSGHIDVVELLLEKGMDVHSLNKTGESAITLAAEMGHKKICLRLLKECHQRAPYVQAAILATAKGHADLLAKLVAAYPWLLTAAELT